MTGLFGEEEETASIFEILAVANIFFHNFFTFLYGLFFTANYNILIKQFFSATLDDHI